MQREKAKRLHMQYCYSSGSRLSFIPIRTRRKNSVHHYSSSSSFEFYIFSQIPNPQITISAIVNLWTFNLTQKSCTQTLTHRLSHPLASSFSSSPLSANDPHPLPISYFERDSSTQRAASYSVLLHFVGRVPLGIKRKGLRVVVTGKAGFVGSHLVDRLIARGDNVTVVDNFFTGRKENLLHHFGNPRFELIHHDIVEPLLVEVDQIYHLACLASPVHDNGGLNDEQYTDEMLGPRCNIFSPRHYRCPLTYHDRSFLN